MYRKILLPFGFLAIMVTLGFITSCQKDDGITSTDNFVNTCVDSIQSRSGAGVFGCYELVFPVTIQFSDTTTATVNSYDELRQAIRTWFESTGGKPNHDNRPTLVFPFQVMNQAGEIITVADETELKALHDLCKPNPGGPGHGDHGNGNHGGGHHGDGDHEGDACFTLVFPITVQFPDSTQLSVASPAELSTALHAWKENNPTIHEKPQFVFPITVTLKDGTNVVVNTPEELRAIKEACRG
jgi:hypothetical protein